MTGRVYQGSDGRGLDATEKKRVQELHAERWTMSTSQLICPQNKRCWVRKEKPKQDAVQAYKDDMQVVTKVSDHV